MRAIANEDLTEADLPPPGAPSDVEAIGRDLFPLAESFVWSAYYPDHKAMLADARRSIDACRGISGENISNLTMTSVRAGLWYAVEGRRWGMFGAGPTNADLPLFRTLLEAVRIRIPAIPTE